jgi:hypothetical protein
MAIDGIHYGMEFLDKIENDEVPVSIFWNLGRADECCAGGILAASNRFLTAELLRKRLRLLPNLSWRGSSIKVTTVPTVFSWKD